MGITEKKKQNIKAEVTSRLADIDAKIKAASDFLHGTPQNLQAFNKEVAEVTELLKTYNKYYHWSQYCDLASKEKPFEAAVEEFYIESLTIKIGKDKKNNPTSISKDKSKSVINLETYARFAGLDSDWVDSAYELLDLLQLGKRSVYESKPEEVANKSAFYIEQVKKACKKKADGEDVEKVASKTSITKKMQEMVDLAIPGRGRKVNNHDATFLMDVISRVGKDKCTVETVPLPVYIKCLTHLFLAVMRKSGYTYLTREMPEEND